MKWLIEYSTATSDYLQIVINCETRTDARKALKKHMGEKPFRVIRITEWSVNHEA